MATIACPGCGLPRADELIGATPCPVCGATDALPLADEMPDGPMGRPKRPRHGTADSVPLNLEPEKARGNGLSLGIFLGFVLGGAAGVAGVLGWQAVGRAGATNPQTVAEETAPPAIPVQP